MAEEDLLAAAERQRADAAERLDRARTSRREAAEMTWRSEILDEATASLLGDHVDPDLWEYRRERAARLVELGVDPETRERLRRLYGV